MHRKCFQERFQTPQLTDVFMVQVTTLLSRAEKAHAEEASVSDEEVARLEKEVSEQGEAVSQIKEVRTLSCCSIWVWALCYSTCVWLLSHHDLMVKTFSAMCALQTAVRGSPHD